MTKPFVFVTLLLILFYITTTYASSSILMRSISSDSRLALHPTMPYPTTPADNTNRTIFEFSGTLQAYNSYSNSASTFFRINVPKTMEKRLVLETVSVTLFSAPQQQSEQQQTPEDLLIGHLIINATAANHFSLVELTNSPYKFTSDEILNIFGTITLNELPPSKDETPLDELVTLFEYGIDNEDDEQGTASSQVLFTLPSTRAVEWFATGLSVKAFKHPANSTLRPFVQIEVANIPTDTRTFSFSGLDYLTLKPTSKSPNSTYTDGLYLGVMDSHRITCFVNGLESMVEYNPTFSTVEVTLVDTTLFIPKASTLHLDCYNLELYYFGDDTQDNNDNDAVTYTNKLYFEIVPKDNDDSQQIRMYSISNTVDYPLPTTAIQKLPEITAKSIVYSNITTDSTNDSSAVGQITARYNLLFDLDVDILTIINNNMTTFTLMAKLPDSAKSGSDDDEDKKSVISIQSVFVTISAPYHDDFMTDDMYNVNLYQAHLKMNDQTSKDGSVIFNPKLTLPKNFTLLSTNTQLQLTAVFDVHSTTNNPIRFKNPYIGPESKLSAVFPVEDNNNTTTMNALIFTPPSTILLNSLYTPTIHANQFLNTTIPSYEEDPIGFINQTKPKYHFLLQLPVFANTLNYLTLTFPKHDFIFNGNFTCILQETEYDPQTGKPMETREVVITPLAEIVNFVVTNQLTFHHRFWADNGYALDCQNAYFTFNQLASLNGNNNKENYNYITNNNDKDNKKTIKTYFTVSGPIVTDSKQDTPQNVVAIETVEILLKQHDNDEHKKRNVPLIICLIIISLLAVGLLIFSIYARSRVPSEGDVALTMGDAEYHTVN